MPYLLNDSIAAAMPVEGGIGIGLALAVKILKAPEWHDTGYKTRGAGACFEDSALQSLSCNFRFHTVDIVIYNMMAGGKNQMNILTCERVRKVYGSGNNPGNRAGRDSDH